MNYEDLKYNVFSMLMAQYSLTQTLDDIINMTETVMNRLFDGNKDKPNAFASSPYSAPTANNPAMYGIWTV